MDPKTVNIPKGTTHKQERSTFTLDIVHTETAVTLTLIDHNENGQLRNNAIDQRIGELEKRISQWEQKVTEQF